MNNLFTKTVRASMTFEEAANILQEASLGPSALEAARFLCQAQWRPGAAVDPAKHPFKAASLFVKSGKADKRTFLGFIHADGEFIEASDSQTLFRLPSSESPGWFTPKGERLEYWPNAGDSTGWHTASGESAKLEGEEPHWPSFERVIPHNPGTPVYLSDFQTESLANPHGGGYTLCSVLHEVSPGVDAIFDARQFDRMRRVGITRAELFMSLSGGRTNMIVAEEKGMTVIVMGLKP